MVAVEEVEVEEGSYHHRESELCMTTKPTPPSRPSRVGTKNVAKVLIYPQRFLPYLTTHDRLPAASLAVSLEDSDW